MKYKDEQEVHLIYLENTLLVNQLGNDLGKGVENEHKTNGVVLHPQRLAVEFRGTNGAVSSIVLDDGTVLEADLVIVGVGVLPATKFLSGSGIELDQRGGVLVDPFLQTTVKDVYAAGDIATFPYWVNGKQTRIEHYNVAMDQGSHVAFNMLGKMVPFGNIPFFWTRHYNKTIQVIGNGEYDDVFVQGDIIANKFVAFFIKDNKIVQVAGQMNSPAVLTFMEAMNQNLLPTAEEVKSGKETWETVRARLRQNKGAGKCKRENCCHKKPVTSN